MSDYHMNRWSPELDRQDELKRQARNKELKVIDLDDDASEPEYSVEFDYDAESVADIAIRLGKQRTGQ